MEIKVQKESERSQLKLKSNTNTSLKQVLDNQTLNLKRGSKSQIVQDVNQPVIQNSPQVNAVRAGIPLVANNSIQGFVPIIKPKQFGSKPISTYCPNCRYPITTVSKRKCNCCSCCWCWCCFSLWILIQCCRQKEMTCCDYEHTCPFCGFVLGNYDAW